MALVFAVPALASEPPAGKPVSPESLVAEREAKPVPAMRPPAPPGK